MGRACLVAVVVVGLLSWGQARAAPDPVGIDTLLSRLASPSDASDAEEATRALVSRGDAAVRPLLDVALYEGALLPRGRAITALTLIGSPEATVALTAIAEDESLEPLVRTWAKAGRMKQARTFPDLLALAPDVEGAPALEAAFTARALVLVDKGARPEALRLLTLGRERPSLQRALFPVVARLGVEPLVHVAFTHDDAALRQLAASHLTSLARRDHHDDVLRALLTRLRFSPAARTVPWDGGPLALPSLSLDESSGRALLGLLLRWYLFAELRDDVTRGRPLHDVMRGVSLAAFPGTAVPGWYARSSATWLALYKGLAGDDEVSALLDEQGVRDDERFRSLLSPSKEAP